MKFWSFFAMSLRTCDSFKQHVFQATSAVFQSQKKAEPREAGTTASIGPRVPIILCSPKVRTSAANFKSDVLKHFVKNRERRKGDGRTGVEHILTQILKVLVCFFKYENHTADLESAYREILTSSHPKHLQHES